MVYVTKKDPKYINIRKDDIEEWSGCIATFSRRRCHTTGNSGEERQ